MRLSSFLRKDLVLSTLCLFVLTFSPLTLLARQDSPQQNKLKIAVLDFDTRGALTKDEASTLANQFQSELVSMGEFVVVDRARIQQILEEQGFQQSEACSQVECIVEAGKILKVEKMFAGTIGKVGEVYSLTVMAIDIATAQITDQASRNHRGDIEDLLLEIIPEMAREMASKITGKKFVSDDGGTSWLWYVLGTVALGGGTAAYLLFGKQKESAPVDETLPPPPGFDNLPQNP